MRNKQEMIKYFREFFQTWTQIKYHTPEFGWRVQQWGDGKTTIVSLFGDVITQFDVFPRPTSQGANREMIINLINLWQFNTWDEILKSLMFPRLGWYRQGTSLCRKSPLQIIREKDVRLRND